MAPGTSHEPLVWIDCEMTGLNPDSDTIMSIACFVTTHDLQLLDEKGFEAVIHHDQQSLEQMGEWCTRQHGASGLSKRTLESTTTPEQAADALMAYILLYVPKPREALLAGNSVHADKAFLRKPPFDQVLDHLHYRLLDVSSIKEAARRWSPAETLAGLPPKQGLHDARADILESIDEARYYQKAIFQRSHQT